MKAIFLFALFCCIAAWSSASTPPPPDDSVGEENWELLAPLVVERLDNGMTFLIYPNKRAPVFSAVIRFDIGGKDEWPGKTGLAHMFEHMAFKGTPTMGTSDWTAERAALEKVENAAIAYNRARFDPNLRDADAESIEQVLAPLREALEQVQADADQYVLEGELDKIYKHAGGVGLNASTSADATTYYISLPSNRLEMWGRIEADRIQQPVMRQFYRERDVVREERRMRRDNSPVGQLWELAMTTAFTAHSYRYPIIGWEEDIASLTATDADAFHDAYYTPDRAVGVIVGDVDPQEAREVLQRTFGQIPARDPDRIVPRHVVEEPAQMGERRAVLRREATPVLLMGWHKPNPPHRDDVYAEALGQVVTGGRGSRWFEELVKRRGLAAEVEMFTGPGDARPNQIMVYATARGETTLTELEAAIREEVARLRAEEVGEEELARAKKALRASAIRALETNMGLARTLSETALVSGDPYYLERRMQQLEAVTTADLLRFVQTYMLDDNLTVATLEPPVADEPPASESDF